jgi:hypothetical protein
VPAFFDILGGGSTFCVTAVMEKQDRGEDDEMGIGETKRVVIVQFFE